MDLASGITVFRTSAVKLLFAAPLAYTLGLDWFQTVLWIALGASGGMLVFYLPARFLLEAARRRYLRRRAQRAAKGLPPKRVFTRTNRFIVRLKQRFGFWGIAVVGPPTISVPVAAVLAAKYFRHDRRTLPTLLISAVGWAFVLSTVFRFLE